MREKIHTGHLAWVTVTTHIAVYDYIAVKTNKPTLSETFHAISRTKGGPLLVGFWVYLSLHLVRFLPEAADVFRRGGLRMQRNAKSNQQ
jgi:hypothetical protein